MMATNLELNDELIREAVSLGRHKTKKEAVTKAIEDYIRHVKQEKIISLFGTIDFDPDFDYKRQRRRS
jgi:hypothetical protein